MTVPTPARPMSSVPRVRRASQVAWAVACIAAVMPLVASAQLAPPSAANDFPTLARVEYVFQCLADSHGTNRHELLYKCTCAADAVARQVPYQQWVELQTFFNARPMAGERSSSIRDNVETPQRLKRYREVQKTARADCFLPEQ